jgi:benzodiazapine receptor
MSSSRSKLYNGVALVGFLLVTFAAPAVSAFLPMTGEWYSALKKPEWNPPSWVFGPVWSVLYTMMAVSAWLVWMRVRFSRPLVPYFVQLALNAAWSPVFFAAHRVDLALLVIVTLWVMIVVTLVTFRRVSMNAGLLLVPYLAWVTFAMCLNYTIWRMNG